jgi:hypothetical protein
VAQDLRLNNNEMEGLDAGALGPYVTAFRELDFGGNCFKAVSSMM